jgi:transglutaminase-like putative cysteine protease
VTHRTAYRYETPVALCHNDTHLLPRNLPYQACHRSQIVVDPEPAVIQEREDFFGNRATYFAVQAPHKMLEVTAVSEVLRGAPPKIDPAASPTWDAVREWLRSESPPEAFRSEVFNARQFMLDSGMIRASRELTDYARGCFPPGRNLLEAAEALNRRIHTEFKFDPKFTTVATPLTTVLQHRRGVCQDFAQLMIGCLRSIGLAARYVSGYLETKPPPGKPRQVGADASHAWVSVLVPKHGWVDFDPTNGCTPAETHITVAWGRDYSDVAPLKGIIFGGGSNTLKVSVDVERIPNSPVSQDDLGAAI